MVKDTSVDDDEDEDLFIAMWENSALSSDTMHIAAGNSSLGMCNAVTGPQGIRLALICII